ncbi:MAG: hypothetical protein ACRC35_03190 [Angustibacter sp.]
MPRGTPMVPDPTVTMTAGTSGCRVRIAAQVLSTAATNGDAIPPPRAAPDRWTSVRSLSFVVDVAPR